MVFVKKEWQNGRAGKTPVNKAELNRIEAGIEEAHGRIGAITPASIGAIPVPDGTAAVGGVLAAAQVTNPGTPEAVVTQWSVTKPMPVLAALSTTNTAAQNSSAIQTAITTAAAAGTEAVLPGGSFDHEGFTLPAAGKVTVRGCGRGKTILRNTHATNASVKAFGAQGGPYCPEWTLSDLQLSTDAVRTGQVALDVQLASRFTVRDLEIRPHGIGVRHLASWNCTYDTISVGGCTVGWSFPVSSFTPSAPVSIKNGSATDCGTAVVIADDLESLTWLGGDFAGSATGVTIVGSETRELSFVGINFERMTGDDVVIGDASTGPAGVVFSGCRFFRTSLVAGSRSVRFVRGVGALFTGCHWSNYATVIRQETTAGTLQCVSPVVSGITTFLDSNGSLTSAAPILLAIPNNPIRLDGAGLSHVARQFKAFDGVATKALSGADKVTVTDSDFITTPQDGHTALVTNATDGTTRHAIRVGGVWKVSATYDVEPATQAELNAAETEALRPVLTPKGPLPYMAAPANVAGHGWVYSGSGSTVDLNDSTDALWGSQAIKLTTGGAGAATHHVTKSGLTLDMTNRDPVLWVKVDDVTTLSALEVRVGDATFANFWLHQFENGTVGNTIDRFVRSGVWHRMTLPWGALGVTTGTPPRAGLTQVRITVIDKATGPCTVHLAGFGFQQQPAEYPAGVCCFTFDDGFDSQFTVARPALDKYGYPATALPIVDLVGNANYMTLAQLKSLQDDYGWEIGAHANTAAAHNAVGAFTSLSAASLDSELRLNKQWLRANGFKGYDLTAYPQGLYNDAVIAATRGYYGAARSQHMYRRDTLPPAEPYRIRTLNLGSTITLATAQAAVDEAAANRELLLFTLHQLVSPATTGSHWLPADFAALVDYVASKGMAVRTLSDALRRI